MEKEKQSAVSPFLKELVNLGVYKRSQGRIARQVTFGVLALTIAIGAYRLSSYSVQAGSTFQYLVPGVILLIGLWLSYRLVNVPRFADFLIAVEAEMNKVSWPSRGELIRSSLVVMFTIFVLAIILFAYDIFWRMLLKWLGILD